MKQDIGTMLLIFYSKKFYPIPIIDDGGVFQFF